MSLPLSRRSACRRAALSIRRARPCAAASDDVYRHCRCRRLPAALPAMDGVPGVAAGLPVADRRRLLNDAIWADAAGGISATGIPTQFIVAQAALETGSRRADGHQL